jgi:hypothetical protein
MITSDYLVINTTTKEEKYVEDAITAEDAVSTAFNQVVVYRNSMLDFYIFDSLIDKTIYTVFLIKKIFFISVGKNENYKLLSIRSDKLAAEDCMKKFPDEKYFNEIEECILDDPRDLLGGVSENENIYSIRVSKIDLKPFESWLERKDVYNISLLGKVEKDACGDYYVRVSAKDEDQASNKALKLIQDELDKLK